MSNEQKTRMETAAMTATECICWSRWDREGKMKRFPRNILCMRCIIISKVFADWHATTHFYMPWILPVAQNDFWRRKKKCSNSAKTKNRHTQHHSMEFVNIVEWFGLPPAQNELIENEFVSNGQKHQHEIRSGRKTKQRSTKVSAKSV